MDIFHFIREIKDIFLKKKHLNIIYVLHATLHHPPIMELFGYCKGGTS